MWFNLGTKLQQLGCSFAKLYSAGTTSLLSQPQAAASALTPYRTLQHYTDWRMLRDVKRRRVVKEYAKLRLNLNGIRKCDFLPSKLRDAAQTDIAAFPTDSCTTKLYARCILTSRARGKYKKFRMSRIIWRHLADYNYISGAERAMW